MEANVEPLLTIGINKVRNASMCIPFAFIPDEMKQLGLRGIGGWFTSINEISNYF